MKNRIALLITITGLKRWLVFVLSQTAAATNSLTPDSFAPTIYMTNMFMGNLPEQSLAVDSQGRQYLAGMFYTLNGLQSAGLVSLQPDGIVDRSFRPPGSAEQPDDKTREAGRNGFRLIERNLNKMTGTANQPNSNTV